jgi:sugar phosphate isomerase/epimerase
MEKLGIDFISVFGLPPVAFVNLAADLGCASISTVLRPLPYNPEGYPVSSLKADKALRREMVAALKDRGVVIELGEGFVVTPDKNAKDHAENLDIMVELGARRINMLSFDPDLARSLDQFARLAEMAAEAGLPAVTEFAPCSTVRDLPTALAAVRHVGRPDFRLVIDTMHLVRSGGGAADLAALDPNLIGYVQLCDVPLKPVIPSYLEEATHERMVPGEGELPLIDILKVLPPDVVISVEVPQPLKGRSRRPARGAAQPLHCRDPSADEPGESRRRSPGCLTIGPNRSGSDCRTETGRKQTNIGGRKAGGSSPNADGSPTVRITRRTTSPCDGAAESSPLLSAAVSDAAGSLEGRRCARSPRTRPVRRR